MRWARIGLVLLAAGAVGFFGSSAVSSTLTPTGDDTLHGDAAVQPDGGGAVLKASTRDPAGGPAWVVRAYRSTTGATCSEAGRTQDGDFGQVDEHGDFKPLDLQAAGSCADLDKSPMSLAINNFPPRGAQPARSVIFGVVGPQVRSLTLRLASGSQPVALQHSGFIAPVATADLAGATLTATMADGATVDHLLRPPSEPTNVPPAP
jgi:hypothetical protein